MFISLLVRMSELEDHEDYAKELSNEWSKYRSIITDDLTQYCQDNKINKSGWSKSLKTEHLPVMDGDYHSLNEKIVIVSGGKDFSDAKGWSLECEGVFGLWTKQWQTVCCSVLDLSVG